MLLIDGRKKTDLPKLAKAVQFVLVNGTYEDTRIIDSKSGKQHIRKNAVYRIPAVYSKFDPTINQNVEYRYAVHEIPVKTGKEAGIKKYSPDKIQFTSTLCPVTPDKPDLYEFLINSPWIENGTNKNPIFREVNPVADSTRRVQREAQRNKAKNLILNDELPEITLRRILAATGDSTEHHIEVVKDKLLTIVEEDPKKFLDLVGSKDTELKALITELSSKNIIEYNKNERKWKWGEKTNDNGNLIIDVPAGKSEIDWLMDTLFREQELLKSFKLLSKAKPATDKTPERSKLESKAKILKAAQGMHYMDDEKLQKKIDFLADIYKKELDNPKTSDHRRKVVEKMLEDAGVLVVN